jgi:predicted dehydrogenase
MPRLRFFESAASQRHIQEQDRYLYRRPEPEYNLAVIGTGTIGQEHMRVASLLGRCRIHGLFDSMASSMEAAEKQFRTYSQDRLVRYPSLTEACSDPDVDALLICTPNYTHHEIFNTAIASGKPLFVEKPMATTLADAASIVRLAQSHNSFVQIGLQYRYKAQYVEAFQEALGRASLGTLRTIAMSEYRPPFLDKVEQWNKFSCYSGGTLVEKCCHYFDLIQLLARAKPVRVFASGGQSVNFLDFEKDGRKSDIDDHAFVIIDYENGVRANFTLNMFSPDFNEELVVCGDKGRLVARERFSIHEQQPAQFSIEVELGETGASRQTRLSYPRLIEQSGHHGATFFEHMALADQLAGLPTDCATPLQGLVSIVIATAAQQSMTSGEAVSIDSVVRDNNLDDLLTEQAWSY